MSWDVRGPLSASRMMPLLLLLLLLFPLEYASGSGPIQITPSEWSFGVISDNESIYLQVTVRNAGSESAKVSFISTCDCLFAPPGPAEIGPRAEQVFKLIFNPAGYEGVIDKDFIVRSTAAGQEKALFRVYGEVRPAGADSGQAESANRQPPATPGAIVSISYFYSAGCRSCERFLAQEIPALESELGIVLEVERADIFDARAYERYLRLLERMGVQERAYPAIVAGQRVLQGDREIEAGLREAVILLARESQSGARQPSGEALEAGPRGLNRVDLKALPVIAAGLLDGVNPCAFTTLIFLVSALAVAGKSRRQVLLLGLVYSAAVFATYFLIGLGFLSAVRYAQSFLLVATIIRWILVGILAVFAALSLYDYVQLRRGETAKVLLQLPSALKKQIHASIRTRARSAALVASALVLGFLVTVFELACTGQIYLPTIVYSVRSGGQSSGYVYLLLYNIGFIAPLLAVFGMSFAGLGLKSLTNFFQRSVAAVKLAMAALFVILGVLTIML